jgi:Ran GTPase-activating protein (RanGAP) involved in mRNA processing and transport
MIADAPLQDVFSILNEFNQNNLDSQSLRLVSDIKKISDFQKESIQDVLEKSQAMISDIIWQRDQLINRIKEECSIRATELKEIILALQKVDPGRRSSKILKPTYNQPLLDFSREIHYSKQNWLKKSSFSLKFSQNGLEKIQSCSNLSIPIQPFYNEFDEASTQTSMIISRKLGDEGARHLSHILPYYTNLTILTLATNFLGPRGGKFIGCSLPYLKKLYKLHINNDRVKDGLISIMRVLPCLSNLEELYLSTGVFYEREAGDIAQSLSIMPHLKNLSILGGVLEGKGAEKLSYGLVFLTSLKTLDLSGNSLGQGGAEVLSSALAGLKNLESLKLSANNFPSSAGEFIGKLVSDLENLEEFWINSNSLGDQGICEMFNQGSWDLRVFRAQDNGIGNIGAKVVFQKCCEWKRLEVVDVSWNNLNQGVFSVFHGNEERYKNIRVELCGMNLQMNGLSHLGFNV